MHITELFVISALVFISSATELFRTNGAFFLERKQKYPDGGCRVKTIHSKKNLDCLEDCSRKTNIFTWERISLTPTKNIFGNILQLIFVQFRPK